MDSTEIYSELMTVDVIQDNSFSRKWTLLYLFCHKIIMDMGEIWCNVITCWCMETYTNFI